MVTVTQKSNRVVFEVEGLHKLWAFKGRLDIPREHILGACIDDKAVRRWWKGIKLPGTWLPGVITAGTFYRDGKRLFWDVSNPDKAVVIDLEHEKYAQLIVEVAEREAVIALLSCAGTSMNEFHWTDPGVLVDQDLELVLVEKCPADPSRGYVPAYKFEMRRNGKPEKIGDIDLRVGDTYRLRMYGGHIGYGVNPEHRGHHYAARACQLLFPLARRHGMRKIWITCNPENAASRRTCELAGAEFVEIVDLPEDIDMYQEGERQKCRYRIDLL